MADNTVFERMVSNTYSKAAFYKRVDLLQEFLESVLYVKDVANNDKMQLLLARYPDGEKGDAAKALASSLGDALNTFTGATLNDSIKDLKKAVEALPEIILYVPAVLSDAQLESLGAWCRAQVSPHILLRTVVESDAVGGCMYVYDNKYHDFSLRYFLKKEHAAIDKLVHCYGAA